MRERELQRYIEMGIEIDKYQVKKVIEREINREYR